MQLKEAKKYCRRFVNRQTTRTEHPMKRDWTADEWLIQYSASHKHPVNQLCHMIGIPMIAASLPIAVIGAWRIALAIWVVGWICQFVGHAFEGKPPEFFRDWRFLLVGLRWWFAKIQGRA